MGTPPSPGRGFEVVRFTEAIKVSRIVSVSFYSRGMHSSLSGEPLKVSQDGGRPGRQPGPAIICLIFLLFGVIWVLLAGVLLPSVIRDPALYAGIYAWKDWAFLAIATLLLFMLIRHYTGRLSESEYLYRTLVENAGSIILAMDREGNITFFNREAEEFFGFPRKEILGKNAVGTIVPATESSGRDLDQLIQDLLSSPGRYTKNRNENVTSEGRRVWVSWTNRAICDETGFPVGVVSVGTDISG
jgi:PAS domain S-box-containing protein